MEEEIIQQLRSKATELLLRERYTEAIQAYSQLIPLYQKLISNTNNPQSNPDRISKTHKSLCLAFSNRAEARSRLRDFSEALVDCDEALKIESAHFKTLVCKGKILLILNKYSLALGCFRLAKIDPQSSLNHEMINGYLEKCKKFESLSKTGSFDLSDWVLNGFCGKYPEMAEYIGGVEIKKSDISGRGLFATKNMDCGTLLLVSKAVATERGILSQIENRDLESKVQLVMWKSFIDKVVESAKKSQKTHHLIRMLSIGEEEDQIEVPDLSLFSPEREEIMFTKEDIDMVRILRILDVNSIVEDGNSAKVLGKNKDYYGIGLWLIVSFINHSCTPNARRLHIGDYMAVHASRDIKIGEEITFSYFDVLTCVTKRKEIAQNWGFSCNCKRCAFEEGISEKQEIKEFEIGIERGFEGGGMVYRLEEYMKRWGVRGKEKGYLRASFWGVFLDTFENEKSMKRWGRRVPAAGAVVDSMAEAVGSDERVLKVFIEGLKRNGNGGGGVLEMERAMKLGRGVYGKIVKKQAMKFLLELCNP